jgi:hypothetical protein
MPRIVTVHDAEALDSTRHYSDEIPVCPQPPRELVSTSWGGTPIPPTPFT